MIRLLNLFHRVGLLRPAPVLQKQESPRQDDAARVTRLTVERLSEDETLRGTLTDAGFAQVIGFVSGIVPPAVERAMRESTADEAEETVSHAARGLARAITSAAESGDTTGVAQVLTPAIVAGDAVDFIRSALPATLPDDMTADERARTLVETLSGAINGACE